MPYPLPLTRTEAYLAYKAGVIQQSDLKPSLAVPRNGIDAWLAYWTGLSFAYPVKNVGKNILSSEWEIGAYNSSTGAKQNDTNAYRTAEKVAVQPDTTYIVSRDSAGVAMNFCEYDANGDFVAYTYKAVNSPITTSHTTKFITMSRGLSGGIEKIMLEEGKSVSQYAPYTGEPLILQEEEAYIAYLCGVITEYPEKCLRRVGAYLRYLISARWGRPDHPLNREELYLSLIKTQFIPSGDPSSDIVIDGTTKAPFVDVKLYGDTFQQTYTGKNLFDKDSAINGKVLSADGTLESSSSEYCTSDLIPVEPNTTYHKTFSLSARFKYYDADKVPLSTSSYQDIANAANAQSFTTPSGAYYVRLSLGVAYLDTLQIELGSTATSYEPYVGGQPSPNPEYPQPIQTVTGEQKVEIVGINILSSTWEDGGLDGATGEEASISNTVRTADFVKVEPNNTYILSRGGAGVAMNVFRYGSDKSFLYSSTISAGNVFTTSGQTQYVKLFRGSTGGTEQMQLQKGSTITPYTPYSRHTYEINLGKNLIDMSQTWVRGTLNNSSVEVQPNDNTILSDYIKVEPNTTYVFSQKQLGGKEVKPNVVSFFKDKVNVRTGFKQVLNSSPQAFTTSNDTCYIRVGYYNPTGLTLDTWLDYVADLQLEVGSTATAYAPYIEPIKLNNIDDTYLDYIWEDIGEWKLHKAVGEVVKTGASSESWAKSNSTANNLFIGLQTDMLKDNSQLNFPVYSDRFLYKNRNTIYAQSIVGITTQTTGAGEQAMRIGLGIGSSVNNVALFREWLSNNPTTVYYPLATPTDTVITDQNLIDQLNALKQGGAEEGTTYIKVNATDPNLPGLLYVEAPKYE